MFIFGKTAEELKNKNDKLNKKVKHLSDMLESQTCFLDEKYKEIDELEYGKNLQIERLKQSYEDEIAKLESTHNLKVIELEEGNKASIIKETSKLTAENTELTIKSKTAEEKVIMYEKAFKNMGLDVRDMRGVLDKLVDGIISNNEIKLITTGHGSVK